MRYTPTDSKALGRFMGDTTPTAAQIELQRTVAASAVIETLRKIISDYDLPDDVAIAARLVIVKAERAFGFLSIAERPVRVGDHDPEPANDSSFDAVQASVSQEMDRR